MITFDPQPPGTDKVGIKTTYFDLVDLVTGDSQSSFTALGVKDFKNKLVGFGADGAAVNSGKK